MKHLLLAVLIVLVFTASQSSAVFIIEKGSHPKVTHGQLQQVFITYDTEGNVTSGDIQYHEGYQNTEGKFISLGVDHMHLGAEMKAWVETNVVPGDKGVKAEAWLKNEKAMVPVRPVVVDVVKPAIPK